ncbi:TPA: IS5/IS1182 family transposase, partial [Streptococcus pneumoniae]
DCPDRFVLFLFHFDIKTFKMFSTTYRNHRKRFGLRMNLIAAIINHELGF